MIDLQELFYHWWRSQVRSDAPGVETAAWEAFKEGVKLGERLEKKRQERHNELIRMAVMFAKIHEDMVLAGFEDDGECKVEGVVIVAPLPGEWDKILKGL